MQNKLLYITGLSGAGLSAALKNLEDCGYEVMDNVPLSLIPALLKEPHDKPLALGLDTRTRAFDPQSLIDSAAQHQAKIIFMDCAGDELQKRFSETRRTHPLAKDRTVRDGIKFERDWLAPLRQAADVIIDTTSRSVHDLRRRIESEVGQDHTQKLQITVMAFGFKHGLPREADTVFDVRFLSNPHWDDNLRHLSGQDDAVQQHIAQDDNFAPFITHVEKMMLPLLPYYKDGGKNYLTIAFGCTGGRHRSVFCAVRFKEFLEKNGYNVLLRLRDLQD